MGRQIEAYYFSHNGGVRENNEDGLLVGSVLISDISMEKPETFQGDDGDHLFCVADGIGGQQKGEVASRIVLSSLKEKGSAIHDERSLQTSISLAKEELEQYVREHPEAYNLGCTLAGICLQREMALSFNIGDCRVYRINGEFFEQITKDHSIVQTLFEEGVITEDEMRTHPRRNVVTSSVSGDGNPESVHIYCHSLQMRGEEIFFICSDGIWGCFSHDELELIYKRFQGYDFCEKLLGAAIARKASDNISALFLHIISIE